MNKFKNAFMKHKKRLLILIFFLVLSLAMIAGATYAWFFSTTRVSIESMTLEVTTSNGLEISSDAKNWSNRLNLVDIYEAAGISTYGQSDSEDAGAINQFPNVLLNMSTIGNIRQTESIPGAKDINRLELFNGVGRLICHIKEEDGTVDVNKWYAMNDLSEEEGGGIEGISKERCSIDGTPEENEQTYGIISTSEYHEGERACADLMGTMCSGQGAIAFDLYLKFDEASEISLAPGSTIRNIYETDYGLKNTIRVAFVTLGTQPMDYYKAGEGQLDNQGRVVWDRLSPFSQGKEENRIYSQTVGDKDTDTTKIGFGGYAGVYGARKMNAFGSISIWEPNAQEHTKAAMDNAKKYKRVIAGADTTDGLYKVIDNEDHLPIPYANTSTTGAKQDIAKLYFAPQQSVAEYQLNTPGYENYKNTINYKKYTSEYSDTFKLFSAPAGVTKIRVYIWVEGNDIDTENNATSSVISASLSFTTAKTSTYPVDPIDFEKYVRTNNDIVWRSGVSSNVTLPSVTGTETGEVAYQYP